MPLSGSRRPRGQQNIVLDYDESLQYMFNTIAASYQIPVAMLLGPIPERGE
jgi:hypothetical protein